MRGMVRLGLPKAPEAPPLTAHHMDLLTRTVFLEETPPRPCDALFVFGGTDPGHWRTALKAYRQGYAERLVVTGGIKPGASRHAAWTDGEVPEARVIVRELTARGVPASAIAWEETSRNSLENAQCARAVFDFGTVRSLMFVGKSHGAGRQLATLSRVLPAGIAFVPYTFDAEVDGALLSRQSWARSEVGRARIWGEYLRMRVYGARGDIADVAPRLAGLEGRVLPYLAAGAP